MKHLNKFVLAAAMAISLAPMGSFAHAQQVSDSTAQTEMSEGEIKKVDKDAGKLTIKHGELKNLGMAGMTMAFKAKDVSMLETVKEGDKVRFVAERVGGALTVTSIETAN
jgi:Cu/Ag efflux protein CusF